MTIKEINEGNKLCAGVLGKTVYPEKGDKEYRKWKGEYCDFHWFQLKYDTSFDWLVPVAKKVCEEIDKIIDTKENEKFYEQAYSMRKNIILQAGKFDINILFKVTVEAIKLLNEINNLHKFAEGEFCMCYYPKDKKDGHELELYYCKIIKLGKEYSTCELYLGEELNKDRNLNLLNKKKGTFTDVCTADLVKQLVK